MLHDFIVLVMFSNRLLVAAFSISLILPSLVQASPSGQFESHRCQYNQSIQMSCDIKHEYTGRMDNMLTTIRWSDGPVTRLSRVVGSAQNTPLTDAYGGLWSQESVRLNGDSMNVIYTNVDNGNQITIFYRNRRSSEF